jgi:hypothetical protein
MEDALPNFLPSIQQLQYHLQDGVFNLNLNINMAVTNFGSNKEGDTCWNDPMNNLRIPQGVE